MPARHTHLRQLTDQRAFTKHLRFSTYRYSSFLISSSACRPAMMNTSAPHSPTETRRCRVNGTFAGTFWMGNQSSCADGVCGHFRTFMKAQDHSPSVGGTISWGKCTPSEGGPVRADTCRLQDGNADPLAKSLKNLEERGELYVGLPVLDARDVRLLRADFRGQLLLGQPRIAPLLLQPLSQNKRLGFTVETVALRCACLAILDIGNIALFFSFIPGHQFCM